MNALPPPASPLRRGSPATWGATWRAAALLLSVGGMLTPLPAGAEGLEGRFEVRSADLELRDGVYQLNARVALPAGDAVRRGLAEGVPLSIELALDIERVRQLLPNARVAELTQRYHLQYNAVSARYILRNDNCGQQQSLGTVEAALEQLADLHGIPVLDKTLLSADRRYEASVRAKADYGTVPFSMRVLMFWVSDWHRESDWYTWTLQP